MRVAVHGEGHLADAARGALQGRTDVSVTSLAACEVLWFCVDTPVGQDDRPDIEAIIAAMTRALDECPSSALVLVSSQVPIGTCAELERLWPDHRFAVLPENVRKASALEDMLTQARFVVGVRDPDGNDARLLQRLLRSICPEVLVMSPESAEMTKHALNAYLALCVTFANEIADLCRAHGADIADVSKGFRSDARVGNGPLRPGRGFEGGTLGRDVTVLMHLGAGPVISAIRASNEAHL